MGKVTTYQKGETVQSDGGKSSHSIYLENWDPNEILDEDIYMKVGLFNDLEDNTPTEVIPVALIGDLVSGIKPKDYEKAFTGKPPSAVLAPELWRDSRDNLVVQFSIQSIELTNLFKAYNVN